MEMDRGGYWRVADGAVPVGGVPVAISIRDAGDFADWFLQTMYNAVVASARK